MSVPKPTGVSRLSRYTGAILGLALLALLLIAAWAISGLSQHRQDTTEVDTAPQQAEGTQSPHPSPTIQSTLVFSIPLTEDGMHYIGETWSVIPGFAIAGDGSFWIADADNRLFHYGPTGELLSTIKPPSSLDHITDIQAWGSDLWVLDAHPGPLTLHKLAQDGRELASYPVPEPLGGKLTIGEQGELLLAGNFTNSGLGTPTPPPPVVTIQPLPGPDRHFGRPFWQLVNAQGQLDPKPLDGYPWRGKLYTARPDDVPWKRPTTGYVAVDGIKTSVAMSFTLTSLSVLTVNPDGSFYVMAEEHDDRASLSTGPAFYRTLLHFGPDAKLLRRARLPFSGWPHLAFAPGGQPYVLVAQPGGPLDKPQRLEMHRLELLPPDRPLPVAPTPTITPVPTPTRLLPTPDFSASTEDLAELKAKADVVAQVRIPGSNRTRNATILLMAVEKWLKNPDNLDAQYLNLYVPDDMWDRMPETFRGHRDPMAQARKGYTGYIIFLNKGDTLPSIGQTYRLTDGAKGAFLIKDGTIIDAGIPKYIGWPAENLKRLITGEPTPVPTIQAEPTSTRAPGSGPVSLIRDGDTFRIDVHEGWVQFASTPWASPSEFIVRWAPPVGPDGMTISGEGAAYLADLQTGKLNKLPGANLGAAIFPQVGGERMALATNKDNTGRPARVVLSDLASKQTHVVYDLDPSVPQWAGADTHKWDFGDTIVRISVVWLKGDAFLVTLSPSEHDQLARLGSWGAKLLLVDITNQQVRLLDERGAVSLVLPDGALLYKSGWIDGELLVLAPPYDGQPEQVAPQGPWMTEWSASFGGDKVAWLELTPPPGDWSQRLPIECCVGDPPPVADSIAVWDRQANQVRRFPVSGFGWPRPDVTWLQPRPYTTRPQYTALQWSTDGWALFYASHPDDKSTRLNQLSLDGRTVVLAQHDAYIGLAAVRQGNDGSIYYITDGLITDGLNCERCKQLMRRYLDGSTETVRSNSTRLEIHEGRYAVSIRDGGLLVYDMATAQTRHAVFPGKQLGGEQLGWVGVLQLAPLSPDAEWAAYAGSQSDLIEDDGRGKFVLIVRVK